MQFSRCRPRRLSRTVPDVHTIQERRWWAYYVARFNRECHLRVLCHRWDGRQPRACQHTALPRGLILVSQVFPPAQVIFAGVGVLLEVCVRLHSLAMATF